MNSVRWEYVKEIFDCSLELDPLERASFLDRVCSHRKGLRAQVDALLKAHSSTHDFSRPFSPMRPPLPEAACPSPPYRIENYWIDKVIARGGMSTVYEAQQIKPRRRVAIKVMDKGMEPRSAFRHAFMETQIMFRLDHPGIAQVYEVGLHTDRRDRKRGKKEVCVPFIVLEYIPYGRPITEYVWERVLPIPEALRLFCIVCDTMDFGHSQGFIHRDLKPGNILVDLHGQVKIIDFGAARAMPAMVPSPDLETCTCRTMGTLQYMSPEQCTMDDAYLDHRSDVYALGLVLYEMLCRKPPYPVECSSLHEAERSICSKHPVPPARVNPNLKGALERIMLKALEKDREKRFDSAKALARDLRIHLAGKSGP